MTFLRRRLPDRWASKRPAPSSVIGIPSLEVTIEGNDTSSAFRNRPAKSTARLRIYPGAGQIILFVGRKKRQL